MPASRPLFVHIGLPKTGTSYLQAALMRSRAVLAEQGLDLVPPTKREAFELMLLVRDRYDPSLDSTSVPDSLARFSALLSQAPGPRALLSQESLAAATPPQIRRFLDACGDREVHVIATVRDLARQLPSSWQQQLKGGGAMTYDGFLRRAQALEQRGTDRRPWRHLDVTELLGRWSDAVGHSRVHVVTLPPPGSPPTTLLERYCSVLEVDPGRMVPEETRVNTSLGRVQAELLRRVNRELPEELLWRQVYGGIGKRFFAGEVLSKQDSRKIRVPSRLRTWCEEVSSRQVAALEEAGYHVEGTLADLRCLDTAFADEAERTREREVSSAAAAALAQMLTIRVSEKRAPGQRLSRARTVADRLRSLTGRH